MYVCNTNRSYSLLSVTFSTMPRKVAADENLPELVLRALSERSEKKNVVVVIREYNEERDKGGVEEMERRCEIGQPGKPTLVTDLLGDPIARIRHSPSHVLLVAEYGEEEKEIVGVVRACIKTVTRGNNSLYVKLAYILGLRVSPNHRRCGIGRKLVQGIEEWCKQKGADYAYMATDSKNESSINLFTRKFSYTKFRTPAVLVQPVHAHYKPLDPDIAIIQLTPRFASTVYHQIFDNIAEFFPKDIDSVLHSLLNLGTFMAMPKEILSKWDPSPTTGNGIFLPSSFAILSVWNTKQVFKLQLKGVSKLTYACCMATRLLDACMPWLRLPSFPDVFRQFGCYVLYGLHMEGKNASNLLRALCAFAHNMARDDDGCGAVVAEVGPRDPIRNSIPHWRKLSWAEDLWFIKKLTDEKELLDNDESDWIKSSASCSVIFVDPRDF